MVKTLSFQGRDSSSVHGQRTKILQATERGGIKQDGGGGGGWQNHLEHHRDGLRRCPPFTVSVCLEKVFCTVGLERRVEKAMLGSRDESYVPSSQISLRVLSSHLTSPRFQFPYQSPQTLGFEEEWIHGYVCLSPLAVHLKLSQHCYLSIPQYKTF